MYMNILPLYTENSPEEGPSSPLKEWAHPDPGF